MSMKRLTLKVASNDDGSIPLLTAFPQGVPFDADDMQVIFGQKGDGRKRKQVLIGDLNGVKYRGDDFGDNSRKNDNNRFAVGYLPEGSKEMTIFQAEHIFVMKPKFDNVVVPARYTSMTNAERKQSLTEEFGSRKKKRALKAAQSNTISSENIAGATAVEKAMANQMDDTDANSVLVNAAEDALEKNRQLLLPTYEIEAVIVDEAYPIKSLIPPHLSNALRERYEVMNTEMLRASSEPAAKLDVFNWVQRLESEFSSSLVSISLGNLSTEDKKSSKKHSTNVSRILLLHYMLRFYLKITASYDRVETRTDIARATSAPEVVLDYFADTFCTKVQMRGKHDSLSCSKASIDKLLLHAIVVALTVNNFSVNLSHLAKDLKLTPMMLGNLAKELGCRIRKQSTNSITSKGRSGDVDQSVMYYADLIVPLKFPERRKPKTGR